MEKTQEQLLSELRTNPNGVCFKVVAGANFDKFKAAQQLHEQNIVSIDQQGATVFVWLK
jgi:hypothetical protein